MASETHRVISECALAAAAALDQFVTSVDVLFEHADGECRELRPTNHLPGCSGSAAHATPRHLMDAVAALDPAFRAMGFLDEHGRPMGKDYTGLWLNGHSINVAEKWKTFASRLRLIGLAASDWYAKCRSREQPDSSYLMTIPIDARRWANATAALLRSIAGELMTVEDSLPVKPAGWTELELTQHATISESTFKRIAHATKLGTKADTGEHGFRFKPAQLRALIATASKGAGKPKWKQAAERWPNLLQDAVAR